MIRSALVGRAAAALVLASMLGAPTGCARASSAGGDAGAAEGGEVAATSATSATTATATSANADGGEVGAASSPSVTDAAPPLPSSPLHDSSGPKPSGLEARRGTVTHIESDSILSANADALRKQHGGAIPASLAVQSTELGAERHRAIIAAAERTDGTLDKPMLFVVDDKGALQWSKDRPVAGIKPPIGPLAIANGPHGRFALAACDPPTSSVALRLWDSDGSPFADFQAFEAKSCDALSLLYWPRHGWLIAIAAGPETRVQLVSENGGLAWGPGRTLGARFRTIAPVSLALDSNASFVLVQYSQSPGADRDVDHAIAYRYDESAAPLWPQPVDLGAVRRVAPGQERILLTRSSDRALTALLSGNVSVELRSNGETRRIP